VITAYVVAFGGLLPFGGRLADLLGRRRTFVAGLGTFTLASLAAGLAPDIGALIAARTVQGAEAALLAPAALSLVTATFSGGAERTNALGVWGAVAAGRRNGRSAARRATDRRPRLAFGVPDQRADRRRRRRLHTTTRRRKPSRHRAWFAVAPLRRTRRDRCHHRAARPRGWPVRGPRPGLWGAPGTLALLAAGALALISFVAIERTSCAPLLPQ
jgi:Major Facilitator Superfamily